DVRFGATSDLEHSSEQSCPAGAWREALANQRLEHRLHLAWRARQQENRRPTVFKKQPRRRPMWIRKNDSALGHQGLPAIDGRHCQAPSGKAFPDVVNNRIVKLEGDVECT